MAKEKVVDVFDNITISAEVGVVKPEAKIFQIALEQAKVKAEEAVFVDDFLVNIEACEELGMQGVLFNDPEFGLKQLNRILSL
jgi:putative hydrolase of the HAD superfamily